MDWPRISANAKRDIGSGGNSNSNGDDGDGNGDASYNSVTLTHIGTIIGRFLIRSLSLAL